MKLWLLATARNKRGTVYKITAANITDALKKIDVVREHYASEKHISKSEVLVAVKRFSILSDWPILSVSDLADLFHRLEGFSTLPDRPGFFRLRGTVSYRKK